MKGQVRIIDIFAGPGGLGEGFSSFQTESGTRPFHLEVSAEKEASAHSTLTLRAFYRLLSEKEGRLPKGYLEYLRTIAPGTKKSPEQVFGKGATAPLWKQAKHEALQLTLGDEAHNRILHQRVAAANKTGDPLVLIGGPPCQAYSLVGRSRNARVESFKTEGDARHFLYREYLEILAKNSPDVFIMENVKGILTAAVGGKGMFAQIHRDLSDPNRALKRSKHTGSGNPEYVLLPINVGNKGTRNAADAEKDPSLFVVRCEKHGVPQARHRVIIMGVRVDHQSRALAAPGLEVVAKAASVSDALAGLPRLRSGLSDRDDSSEDWITVVEEQRLKVARCLRKSHPEVSEVLDGVHFAQLERSATHYAKGSPSHLPDIRDPDQDVALNHQTRGHMESDLGRYLFCAAFAKVNHRSPASSEFPESLAPAHRNWKSGAFADRFRAQVSRNPSGTVTSHLSKDGHAFIHYDPGQCRSLTVREAARLQTFPDDYLFLGNRTQQFVQVGNAVPPHLARQIASIVYAIVGK